MIANAQLLWRLVEHLALTGAPAIAGSLLATRLGVRNVPVILAVALAASGVTALLAFWAYYADPVIGQVWAYVVLLGSIELAVWCWYKARPDPQLLRQLRTPFVLWILGSFFVVFLGFLHGGTDQAIAMSATRFSHQLPSDNDLPQFFANWFYTHGHAGVPPPYPGPGEWLMSDRPPLQIGYVLAQRTYAWDTVGLHYQVLGVVIQQLWILGMWAALCAARLRPVTRSLVIFAAMVSDIALVHGFFVWPKLLAASFVLGGAALVLSPEWTRWRRESWAAGLFACLCGLAMLAHGSSFFGIVPLLIIAFRRGVPSGRWLGVAALVGVALLVPWSAYQRYGDPPGNRLLKLQLAGVVEPDNRSTLEAIVDGYRGAGLKGTIENKWHNFTEMVGLPRARTEVGEAVQFAGSGELGNALGKLRMPRFFSLLPFLGVFLVAPFAMLLAWKRKKKDDADWRFAIFCFGFFGIGCLIWGLLLFGTPESRTTIHVASLTLPLLALAGCVSGLRATYPRLAVAMVTLNVLIVLVLYTPSLTPLPGTSYSPIAAVLAAASLLGFGLVAFCDRATPRSLGAEQNDASSRRVRAGV